MDVHVRPRLAPKTAERYGSLTAHVSRAIGDTALENVNAFLLEQLYAALRLRLSARSVRHVHECINSAFAAAVRWDNMLSTNPVGRCRLPPADPARSTCYRFAETGDLIAATAASWVGPAVQLAAATGARRTPRAPLVGLRCTSRRREDPGSDQLCRFGTNPEVNQEPAIANRTPA
jgi:hypothetical protein